MKKIFFLLLLGSSVISCVSTNTTTIIGHNAPESVHVVVQYRDIDTTLTTDNGNFSIELPTDRHAWTIVYAEEETVSLIADGTTLTLTFQEGMPAKIESDKPQKSLALSMVEFEKNMDAVRDRMMEAYTRNPENIREIMQGLDDERVALCRKAIAEHPDDYIGGHALDLLQLSLPMQDLLELANTLSPEQQAQHNTIEVKKAAEAALKSEEGMPFVDFEVLQDPDDPSSVKKLSDYVGKGSYVLVDFWASWCSPCIQELPYLKAAYENYGPKGLVVLGVAVWDRLENTEKAIADNQIEYPQILNGGEIPIEAYGIRGVPYIILFGPDGTILKRDLRGEGIAMALENCL